MNVSVVAAGLQSVLVLKVSSECLYLISSLFHNCSIFHFSCLEFFSYREKGKVNLDLNKWKFTFCCGNHNTPARSQEILVTNCSDFASVSFFLAVVYSSLAES